MAATRIFVDPGHGGTDSGAVGPPPTRLRESFVNVEVGNKLAQLLKLAGLSVAQSRTNDSTFPSLADRTNASNAFNAQYFVSIHCNGFKDPAANGVETLVRQTGSEAWRLAGPIQAGLVDASGERSRGIKIRTDLHVLNASRAPAVLVELPFITNPQSQARLATSVYRDRLAYGIFSGIAAFLNLEMGPGPEEPKPPTSARPIVTITAPAEVEIKFEQIQSS